MLLYVSFLIKMHNMSPKALEKEGTYPTQVFTYSSLLQTYESGKFMNVCGIDDQCNYRERFKKDDGMCMLLCTV